LHASAAVQDGPSELTTEVSWRHHRWGRHHGAIVAGITATGAAGKPPARELTEQARSAGLPVSAVAEVRKRFLTLETVMKRWMALAMFAGALVLSGPAAIGEASAAALHAGKRTAAASQATDFSVRRYYRHGYRPYYYARPTYYRPYPYNAPAPFTFGFGFGPFWW
jgi:hypothetical protein